MLNRWIFTAVLALCASAAAQVRLPQGVAPLPVEHFYPLAPVNLLPDGAVEWFSSDYATGGKVPTVSSWRWQPASGQLDEQKLPLRGEIQARLATAQGELFVLGAEGGPLTAALGEARVPMLVQRSRFRLIAMPDQSVIVLGGRSGEARTNAAESIRFEKGQLKVERLPDLPGEVRTGYAAVALRDGRLFVTGGNPGQYIGCMPCSAETWLFDPAIRSWRAGPALPEARTDASATLLPDGAVLIAGGWTAQFNWSEGPSAATLRYDPQRDSFTPSSTMPSPVAMHKTLWLKGQLLLAGGNSAAVQAYDPATGIWRMVGEACGGDEKGSPQLIPFSSGAATYLWHQHGEGVGCAGPATGWTLDALRLPGQPAQIDPLFGIGLYRTGLAFVPAQGSFDALAIGGKIHFGMNTYLATGAVDAFNSDGTIRALPALPHPRDGASAARLPDGGILVIGGHAGKANQFDDLPLQPPVWLPPQPQNEGKWITLSGTLPENAVLGKAVDGQVLAIASDGAISRIGIDHAAQPALRITPLATLPQARRAGEQTPLLIKGTANGRIIVAGGQVGAGEDAGASATRHYDIFDPASGKWQRSAPSRGNGSAIAILADGRVVRLSRQQAEISKADGSSWSRLGAALPLSMSRMKEARLFVIQDELFASGKEMQRSAGADIVQWFNGASRHWEIVWEASPGSNADSPTGRLIARQLANGKHLILPVAGD
ncbi:MAG TPA: kelch repeat-containing protein [Telluria sp.]|jgi:hypothetical protein